MSNTLLSAVLLAVQSFNDIVSAMSSLISDSWSLLIGIASGLTLLWGFYLGMKWWLSSGDENKRKEAKSALISFVIGTVVIFAIAVGAPLLITGLSEWLSDYQ